MGVQSVFEALEEKEYITVWQITKRVKISESNVRRALKILLDKYGDVEIKFRDKKTGELKDPHELGMSLRSLGFIRVYRKLPEIPS